MTAKRPIRPSAHAEHVILDRILSGHWSSGTQLPAERELATEIGVTRPTLRETLKSLESHGWISIHHGKPSMVNDFWDAGGLGILGTLARYPQFIPLSVIRDLMEVRHHFLPMCAMEACAENPEPFFELLESWKPTEDAEFCAQFDWNLQNRMVRGCDNRVFTLIFNDFNPVFAKLGAQYFSFPETRMASHAYYTTLRETLESEPHRVGDVVMDAMAEAIRLWDEMIVPLLQSLNEET